MSQETPPSPVTVAGRLDSALLALLLITSGLVVIFLLAARGAGLGAVSPTPPPTAAAAALSPSPGTPTLTPSPTQATPAPADTLPPVPTPRVEPLALEALYAGVPFGVEGLALPGQTIAIFDNDVLLGQWTVDSSGRWRIEVPAGLPVGEHRLVVVAIGPDGRRSEAAPAGFTLIHAPALAATAESLPDAAAALTTKQAEASATQTGLPAGTPVAGRPSPSPTPARAIGGPLQTQSSAAIIQQAASPTPSPTRTRPTATQSTATRPTATRPTATLAGAVEGQVIASPTPVPPREASPSPATSQPTASQPAASTVEATPVAFQSGGAMPLLAVDPQVSSQAGVLIFSGQGEPGGMVTLLAEDGALLGTAPVGPDGRWTVEADPDAAQGAGQVTAQLFDPAGIIVAQAIRPQEAGAPLLPVTGQAAAPRARGPALIVLLGLALLTGGLALRQAGRVLTEAAPSGGNHKKGTLR